MGVLGRWITNDTTKPFYARRGFEIGKNIAGASLMVCGLGQFICWINGIKVSDHELDPGWTDYNKIVEYVEFDVSEYLLAGENTLGIEVGNGWFIKDDEHYTFAFPPFMPPNPNGYKPYGKSLMLSAKLVISYEDGSQDVIPTDESWLVKEHPTVMTNVYGSETIDGRLTVKDWSCAGLDTKAWTGASLVDESDKPKGELIIQEHPPVKVIKTYEGVLINTVNGRDIYDFGQNISGLMDFEIKGKAGDIVRIYPAEKLGPDGDVDQMAKNWIMVDACTTAIVGEDDVWESCRMKFAYFAGRYVAVELETIAGSTKPEIRALKADALSSAFKTDGSFTCDDERYNKIYDMIEKTVEANMTSGVHTDCPTIERFAWQEPNHLMAPAIMYMKDGKELWAKFLLDMRSSQHTADDWFNDMAGGRYYPGDGLMPAQCPCYIPNVLPVPGLGDMYDIIAWGSTCILGTYWHYQFYGDKKIIEDNFDAGMRYYAHLKTRVNDDGFINYGLGDWGNPRGEYVRENIETAFLYADAKTLAEFAAILEKPEISAQLMSEAEAIKDNYNAKLLVKNEELGVYCYKCWDHPDELFMTQASQALPLFWGMVPEDMEADVVKAFAHTLDRDGAFISGEVGLPYVIQTARKYGMNDVISRFILKEEHPSYYAFILDGETTLGEYWESNPRSHCHDMMGHIIEWYYNGIAGIISEAPGFAKMTIRPYLPESMNSFSCSYNSVRGTIGVEVARTENGIMLDVSVPDGIECIIDRSNLE